MDAQAGQLWHFVLPYAVLSNWLAFLCRRTNKHGLLYCLRAPDAGR